MGLHRERSRGEPLLLVVSTQDMRLLAILHELEGVARSRYEQELAREGLEILCGGKDLARIFFRKERTPLLPRCKCDQRTGFVTSAGVPYCSKCNPRRERR